MIFVTVGTHEQPFDRLVRAVDELKAAGRITDEVFIQTGYCRYRPIHCRGEAFLSFTRLREAIAAAAVVITHGGTGSIMLALHQGQTPLVMPRRRVHGEHIDDHQVLFCRKLAGEGRIAAVYEVEELGPALDAHPRLFPPAGPGAEREAEERSRRFSAGLEEICRRLTAGGRPKDAS